MRRAMSRTAFKEKESDFDNRLNEALDVINSRCAKEFDVVLNYLQSLALVLEVPPENIERVKYEYHRKSLLTSIIKRLGGLDDV